MSWLSKWLENSIIEDWKRLAGQVAGWDTMTPDERRAALGVLIVRWGEGRWGAFHRFIERK